MYKYGDNGAMIKNDDEAQSSMYGKWTENTPGNRGGTIMSFGNVARGPQTIELRKAETINLNMPRIF